MNDREKIRLAEWTRQYLIYFFIDFDHDLIDLGPVELFEMFFSHFGYSTSDFIMVDIVPTGVFSAEELSILSQIENYLGQIMEKHKNAISWNNIRKEEYLKIKSLSYDFLNLVYKHHDY